MWKPGVVDDGLVVLDVLCILCGQGDPHGCSVKANVTLLQLVLLGFASCYPRQPWKAPQCTAESILGPPVWRNQGQHKPSQTKIESSTVSALVLPLSLLPDVRVSTQGSTSPCHTPHSQEHHCDGAGGHQQEPQAKQCPRAAEEAPQGGSLVPMPCQSKEASAHFWKHLPTTEKTLKGLILDYFYFIRYTEQ